MLTGLQSMLLSVSEILAKSQQQYCICLVPISEFKCLGLFCALRVNRM